MRYFDARARRPGLPPHIAALVTGVEKSELRLTLVNMGVIAEDKACVILQAGTLREHTFTSLSFTALKSVWPAQVGDYAAPDVETAWQQQPGWTADTPWVSVDMPPGTQVDLRLGLARNVNTHSSPTYAFPWH